MSVIEDAARLPRLPDQTNTFSNVSNANSVADGASQILGDTGQLQRSKEGPQRHPFKRIQYVTNDDGTTDISIDMPQETLARIMPLIQTGQATMDAFAAARMRLASQRQFMEQHPIISAVGKIASTAAAGYAGGGQTGQRISPLVRAAGAYGLEQFGATPQELSQQEAGLAAQQFQVQNQITNQQQDEARFQMQKQDRDQELALRRRSVSVEEANVTAKNLDRLVTPYQAAANSGTDVSEAFLKDPQVKNLMTPAEAKSQASALAVTAQARIDSDNRKKAAEDERDRAMRRFQAGLIQQNRVQDRADKEVGRNTDRLLKIDQDIEKLATGASKAESYFQGLTSVVPGSKVPSNAAEARKLIGDAAAQDPTNSNKILEEGGIMISAMKPLRQIQDLQKIRKAVVGQLPKEDQAIYGRDDLDDDDLLFMKVRGYLPSAAEKKAYLEAKKKFAATPGATPVAASTAAAAGPIDPRRVAEMADIRRLVNSPEFGKR